MFEVIMCLLAISFFVYLHTGDEPRSNNDRDDIDKGFGGLDR